MATIVDIYCRSAVDGPETRAKLEAQETACRAYCLERGLSVGIVHYEVASGSTYGNRERLGLMRTRYQYGTIQGIVVSSLDRLSRSQTHLVILIGAMEEHGVTFHCVNEYTDDTATGKFVRFILDIVAKIEQEKVANHD